MSEDSGSDDLFVFQSEVNFDAQQEEKETMISNDQHFKLLSEICDNFYTNLQKHDDFNHKSSWQTYSNLEPIKIEINTQETIPGICDIIKSEKNFYNKVIMTFSSLIYEIDNQLPNLGFTCYESLYPLSMYGEIIEDEEKPDNKQKDSKEAEQISYMLPYINEIYEKILTLLTIAINLLNQLLSLYTSQRDEKSYYNKSFKNYTFDLPFEYLGKILSYFNTIDTIVKNNEFLKSDWDKYRTVFHKCKNNSTDYNMTEEQKKHLDRFIKRANASIFEKTCYTQSIKMIIEKSGEPNVNGTGIKKINECVTFLFHLTAYLKNNLSKIYDDLGTITEAYEPIKFYQYLSLFGFYLKLLGNKADKGLVKSVWVLLSKKNITDIPLVGLTNFEITGFLKEFEEYKNPSYDEQEIVNNKKSYLNNFEKTLPILMNNLRLNVMTWITRVESDLFDFKTNMQENNKTSLQIIIDKSNQRVNFIIIGLSLANFIRKNIVYILDSHLDNGMAITEDLVAIFTTGFELIKVIEAEFYKIIPIIALNLNVINRVLYAPLQNFLKKAQEIITKKVKDKDEKKSPLMYFFRDQLSAIKLLYSCSQSIPSQMRLVIVKLCLNTISGKESFDADSLKTINTNIWKLEMINNLSREIVRSCDCSFFYKYISILPDSLKVIYKERPIRIYYFTMAVNDMEKPLMYIKYMENNGYDMIKILRKNILRNYENYFLNKICKEIEDDLRKQIHRVFIEGLKALDPTDFNLNSYLKIKNFKLFDVIIDIKKYVEEHMNMVFYKMTTLNLNDWQTYQQMRVLAKNKYDLNLHEIYLPSQNLVKGKDILDIIRNLKSFTKNFTHNLHNQIFIEIGKSDSSYINIIGVQQILNSLYTHGTGIVNTVLNKAFGYISRTVKPLLDIFFDDYILSMLKDERIFWNENKAKINYNYPLDRALNLRTKILTLDENKKVNQITKAIQYITQIGNVVGLARCIRTALMDYNSHNVHLLNNKDISDFHLMTTQISLEAINDDPSNPENNSTNNISSNLLSNTQNSLNDSNKIFCETINNLKQIGKNSVNYLEVLVTTFGDTLSSAKVPDIELFAFLLPPLTISFIDNAINARDNLMKKNKNEESAYFSDDGFMVGVCYLLKIFSADKRFESLNWFPSVISYYRAKQVGKQKKDRNSYGVNTLNERQINSYKEQFEIQYFTYSSASILFTE